MRETEFERELEIFRREEVEAQQHFFCWLAVRDLAARNATVLSVMNATPLFWLTTHHSMLLAAFIALGRVFDRGSEHNLDRLMKVAVNNLRIFSKDALRSRKEAYVSKEEAAAYLQNAHELTSGDVTILKGQIAAKRRVYEARYREVRNKIFAHAGVIDPDELFAKTSVDEIKGLLGFLHALYMTLDQLFLNGRKLNVTPYVFKLPPDEAAPGRMAPGERVY